MAAAPASPPFDESLVSDTMSTMSLPQLAGVVAFGTLEGYAFFKCGLVAPAALRDQMEFKSMIVMKLFISAVGASMVTQSVMARIWRKRFEASRTMSQLNVGYGRVVAGCGILGAGMATCGAGPTMIPASIAAGSGGAVAALAGAIVGGALYDIVESKITLFSLDVTRKPDEKTAIDEKLGVSYEAVALPMGLAMLGATAGLEYAWPHAQDVARLGTGLTSPILPIFAGLAIGFNQLPLRLLNGDGQGGSTAIMNMVAMVTGKSVASRFFIDTVAAATQLFYLYGGTVIGALFAWMMTEPSYTPHPGYGDAIAFAGGVLSLFGARMACGCTCGHGISGMSELALQSFAGGMSIFGGGIIFAQVLKMFM